MAAPRRMEVGLRDDQGYFFDGFGFGVLTYSWLNSRYFRTTLVFFNNRSGTAQKKAAGWNRFRGLPNREP
jgi:hypothetical protein